MGTGDKTTRLPPPARPRKHQHPWLLVITGASAGHALRLDRAQTLVGREPPAQLVLEDSGVSRRHVKIVRASDGIFNLVDLDSTNGVHVNGVPVDLTVLRDRDRISLGPEVELLFTYDERALTPVSSPSPLSPRQLEVARLVCRGLTNATIGEALGISTRTVTSHLDHIYSRLDIGSRAELASYLAKRGLD